MDATAAPLSHCIPIGLIGLSASAATSWAADAHLPSLRTSHGQKLYRIAALCNSSVDAAEQAIDTFGLDKKATRAYGSPEDLAADNNIHLVVCVTRVDKHYETIMPSIVAGKDVYVEWPIASNIEQIHKLNAAAAKSGSRVAVGLQRRFAPSLQKVREILEQGNVGRVLSSSVQAAGGVLDRQSVPTGLKYFTDPARHVDHSVDENEYSRVLRKVATLVTNTVAAQAYHVSRFLNRFRPL